MVACYHRDTRSGLFCLVRMDFYTVGTGTLCKNIRYISTTELKEVLNRNFGGGWGSLSRSIQNIILSNFDVSTITLQKDRLHKEGGFYEKKVKDGFTVLEIPVYTDSPRL